MNINRYRDLTILDDSEKKLVIACDSSGAIGPKELDVVKVDGRILGRFTSRVVLMELISVGTKPIALIDTLAVEMKPTGGEIIAGIIEEISSIGLKSEEILNGSTEENVPVQQTGIGITGIGQGQKLYCKSFPGDIVLCLGIPKVGHEVKLDDPEIVDLLVIQRLRRVKEVHEIVPVGSKGIAYEVNELKKRNQLLMEEKKSNLNINKSSGPATCVVFTAKPTIVKNIDKLFSQQINILGTLKSSV